MNPQEFETLSTQVQDIFAALYLVDVGSLSPAQREQHQEALSTSYLALIRLENANFQDLTAQTRDALSPLSISTKDLQAQLVGLKQAEKTLSVMAQGLKVLSGIVKVLST